MLACVHLKFALLEQSRTVKKMAVVVRKISGRDQEKAKYGLKNEKGRLLFLTYSLLNMVIPWAIDLISCHLANYLNLNHNC